MEIYQFKEAHGVSESVASWALFSRWSSHTSPASRVNFNQERLTRDRQHDIRRTGHVLNDIEWSFVRELRTDWAQRPVSPYLMPPPPDTSRSSSLISNTVGHLSLAPLATYTSRG